MCSGSEAGSYSRLIDFVYHSTLGLRVIKKDLEQDVEHSWVRLLDLVQQHHLPMGVQGLGFRVWGLGFGV